MDITLPVGAWLHKSEADAVTWAMPNHTESSPYVVIFKRRPLNGDTSNYQVKIVRSHTNATTGSSKNQIVEVNFRNISWQDATDAAEVFDVLQGIVADADLEAKALTTGALPYA